jgi:hypothetical protein
MAKKITFTVHDCGCVEASEDSDGFEYYVIAAYLMDRFDVPDDAFDFVVASLKLSIQRLKSSNTCVFPTSRHLN